jgi:hypothetical protein
MNPILKQARGHFFDLLAIICGILAYLQTAGIAQFLPEQYAWVPIALGAVNIGLHGILAASDGKLSTPPASE